MSTSNSNSIGDGTVYHPLGAIRLLSPAEQQSARRSAAVAASPNAVQRALGVLRRFARVWVQSQEHRNGF
jgi:hypothetical protein